ncbi:hypothetical protein BKA67DRAFT_540285 [Truncatella angustata]|uniref:Uncharacterized protein n=1 Tax=Truncatella angustata TaxID=152316 RepID=A0A9P8RNN5_9PEZI|nr:uncharacterized protein BKA67DRAFT_540285 [Truncatella angustata]KAH6646800.1 hypothetical protein BKA67DRAFT_540285 [Truncatella angustata]
MGFLDLPVEIRNNIYRQLLVAKQTLMLFKDRGSEVVEVFVPGYSFRALPLLRTNRRVQEEACAILYGSNCFNFVDTTEYQGELLCAFLKAIGVRNASLLTHVSINFPALNLSGIDVAELNVVNGSLWTVKLLQEQCTNLRILETIVQAENSFGLVESDDLDSSLVGSALSQVQAQFEAIPNLKKVVVTFYTGIPSTFVRNSFEGNGWVVQQGR